MDWFLGSLEFTYRSFAVRFEDRPISVLSPLIEILTIYVLHTLVSVPSVYQNVTELHRQLSICNCSSTTEYFRSINDAFERKHNVVSLKFRFGNDSDNINMITQ